MSGPTLLFDKCTFQALSRNEVSAIGSCFFVNLPPILTLEILADLKKAKNLMKDSAHEVQVLSDKMLAMCDPFNNVHYAVIVEGEVQGYRVEMRGVTAIGGGKRIPLKDGKLGVFFDEHPDRPRFRNWAMGKFSPEDEQAAEALRAQSKRLNIEQLRTELWRKVKGIPKPLNLAQARQAVDRHLSSAPQYSLLTTLMDLLHFSQKMKSQAAQHWRAARPESFEAFAPYSCHVLRTILLYVLGLAYGLVGTRNTNPTDLEYLFYLPFCKVFSSGDNFVIEMSRVLIKGEQFFISREELKRDMKAVYSYLHASSDQEKAALASQYDNGQPDGVFTNAVWQQLNEPPWKRPKHVSGSKMTAEEQKALFEEFKTMMEAAKQK